MRARRVWLGIAAIVLVASALPAWSMELRDMPPWLRDMIETVHVTTPDAEASAETAGVHIWEGQGAIGAAAVPPGTGPVSLSATGSSAAGGVRAPGADNLTAAGVTMAPMAEEWDEALRSIEGLDGNTIAQGGQILAMIRGQNMAPEEFLDWAKEHQPTPEALTVALLMGSDDWRAHYPAIGPDAEALVGALRMVAGAGLEDLDRVPLAGRPYLAIHFGKHGDGQLALVALNSLTDDELLCVPRALLYRASSHLMNDAPRVAVEVLRRYGRVFGVERMLCHELMRTCRYLGDANVVKHSLIPYAEEALAQMPPTDFWEQAVIAVVWGYSFCGSDTAAAAAGREWLARMQALGYDMHGLPALRVKAQLAGSLARAGEPYDATMMLQDVLAHVPPSSALSRRAQAELMEVLRSGTVGRHHDGGAVR